jgi:hypothetical protein
MQCSERVVALPDPKNVEKHQPNQHLRGSNPASYWRQVNFLRPLDFDYGLIAE